MKFAHEKNDINLRNNKDRDRMYTRFDTEQKDLFHKIQDNIFTYCEACAGSGKTTVSVAAMVDLLANEDISKIVYVRVADDRAQSIGYMPGTMEEKTEMYWGPFYEAMETIGFQREMVTFMISQGLIETTLDINLRGRNLEHAGIILDEVQNADTETMRLIFTRVHDNSHIVAIGDGRQSDQKRIHGEYKNYCEFLAESSMGARCVLTHDYRGKFSALAESFEPYLYIKERKKIA